MTNYAYAVVFTDEERRKIAEALQLFIAKLSCAAMQFEASPQVPVSPTAPAPNAPSLSTTVPVRDRWARDRNGKQLANPEGCYSVEVHVFKAEAKETDAGAKRMLIAFDSPTGRGSVNASCWDERLFPFLAVASKELKATLHIVKNGKYLNVVGVRA
jgi:hypothetical protein